jgi:porin
VYCRSVAIDSQVAVGIEYQGPLDIRPKDFIGLAFGRTHVNDRVAAAQEAENAAGLGRVPVQHAEYATDFFYNIHLTDWLYLCPNIRYIHQAGELIVQMMSYWA